jgi:serine/threonine-protein kinase RsbW
MSSDVANFSLALPTDPRMLSVARTFLEAVCQTLQVDRSTTHAVVMACGEAVVNIIRHAHRNRPQAQIQIQVRITPDAIMLDLQDEGEPFDFAAIPDLNPAEMRLGGRGVYMIRNLMDQVSCQSREGGNCLHMEKRWPSSSECDEQASASDRTERLR